MYRFLIFFLMVAGLAAAANAQSQPTPLHVTDALVQSADGQAALEAFRAMKESGFQTLRKSGSSPAAIGHVQTFTVRRLTDNQTEQIDFTLSHSEALFNLWVETSQLAPAGPVQQADLDALAHAIGSETPSGSWNPGAGIIENDQDIFGNPPNVDGDGKTDILLHDIKDDYDPNVSGSSAVFGYFDPNDLSTYNFRDIVHLDVMPAMYLASGAPRPQTGIHQTLAHEFQHLIFAGFQTSASETFIDEGLAEWAEVQNGYVARSITYLSVATEWNQSMLNWRTGGGPNQYDYQRAGLFTNYLGERIGVEATGRFSRSSGQGVGKYVTELNTLTGGAGAETLRIFVQGFHVANLLNNVTVSPDYGYTKSQYTSVRADGIQSFDGTATNSSPGLNGSLLPGGVRYFRWTDVGDFSMTVGAGSASQGTRLAPLVILREQSGTVRIVETVVGGEGLFQQGNFAEVFLVLPHVDLTQTVNQSVSWTVNASWADMSSEFSFVETLYDTGERIPGSLYYSLGETFRVDSRVANRFETPVDMRVESVDVSVSYKDMFKPTSSTSRDFRLRLFNADEPINGRIYPGEEILSLDVIDASQPNASSFTFQRVDLSDEQFDTALSQLDNTFFVSIENAGTDDNHIWVGMSSFSGTDHPGVAYHPFSQDGSYSWARFQDIESNEQKILENQVVPIRVRFSDRPFSVSTADEPEALPSTAVLNQNWPNPFNPTTSISFELAQSGPVRLSIYDLLGREVATLVDGVRPAGLHQVRFDATAESSGMYLYTLETPSSRITRRMLLIK